MVGTNQRGPTSSTSVSGHWLDNTPVPSSSVAAKLVTDYEKKKKSALKKNAPSIPVTAEQMQPVAKYLEFLKLPESQKTDVENRLFESSLQFLTCSAEDWACLEKTPAVTPLAQYRIDAAPDLGKAVSVGKPLDISYFFTQQWYRYKKEILDQQREVSIPDRPVLAGELLKALDNNWSRVSMAIYGIDGIGELDKQAKNQPNHSMDGVFSAIKSQPNARAVVDVETYKKNGSNVEISYQYPPTQQLLDQLNQNTTEDSQRVRLEYPTSGIMHNKFFVFEKN